MTAWGLSGVVQFGSGWYEPARKNPYSLHHVSQKFPQCCLWSRSSVCLIDDGPLSSFRGTSSSVSSVHASLLQAIDGVMSLALCPHRWCHKLLGTSDLSSSSSSSSSPSSSSSELKSLVMIALHLAFSGAISYLVSQRPVNCEGHNTPQCEASFS